MPNNVCSSSVKVPLLRCVVAVVIQVFIRSRKICISRAYYTVVRSVFMIHYRLPLKIMRNACCEISADLR